MKIFITGICGFVGSALARQLRELLSGAEVSGMDSLSRPGSEINRRSLASEGIRVRHGDVRCASDFETLPDADWVIDAAAQPSVLAGVDGKSSPRQLIEHNLLGTVNILEYCRRTGAGLILLSTSRVYSVWTLNHLSVVEEDGRLMGELMPDAPYEIARAAAQDRLGISEDFPTTAPVSLYGATKLASEALAAEYADAFNIPVRINRCGVLAGAGQFGTAEQGIFSWWIHSWHARRPLRYLGFDGTGKQTRDALHPDDLAELIAAQMLQFPKLHDCIFNVGGGVDNSMSLAQLSEWCRLRLGPHHVAGDGTPRKWDVPWLVMNSARARKIWTWRPQRSLPSILEEIAQHAEANPGWLDLAGG